MVAMLFGLVLLFCGAASAQKPPQETATVSATAVDRLSGEPLERVHVTLRRINPLPRTSESAVTGGDGKFMFEGVVPGTYELHAARRGYLGATYGAPTTYSPGTAITLQAGEAREGVKLELTPQAVLTGTVFDETNEPLEGPSVRLSQWVNEDGRLKLSSQAEASTNDIGEFRLAGLAPGRYYLVAETHLAQPIAPPGGRSRLDYVPTYFPGVDDISTATAIEIKAGQQVSNLMLRLLQGAVYTIRGRVAGAELARTGLYLRNKEGRVAPWRGWGIDPNGHFEVRNVRSGSYQLIAFRRSRSGFGGVALGMAPVEVGSDDVRDIVVSMREPVRVRGRVQLEDAANVRLDGCRVNLSDATDTWTVTTLIESDGSFDWNEVGRDLLYPALFPMPPGVYLKAVRQGDEDVTDRGVDFTAAESGEFMIILSGRVASIEGVVSREKQTDPVGTVLLLPDPHRPRRTDFRPKTVTVDEAGWFRIADIAPGTYRLYAFDEYDRRIALDPEFLKSAESKSERIELAEQESRSVTLKQIRVADLDRRQQ